MNPIGNISHGNMTQEYYDTFWILYKLQKFYGCCRINVKNKCVSPLTIYQKLYTMLIALITLTLYFASDSSIDEGEYYKRYPNMQTLIICIMFIHAFSYLAHLIHVRFSGNEDNVDFVLSINELDRRMNIDKNKSINKTIRRHNNVLTLSLVMTTISYSAFSFRESASVIIFLLSTLSLEGPLLIDTGVCSSLMLYFTVRLRVVNAIISNHLNKATADSLKAHSRPGDLLDNVISLNIEKKKQAPETQDFESSDTDVFFRKIVEVFFKFQRLYRFQVSVFMR